MALAYFYRIFFFLINSQEFNKICPGYQSLVNYMDCKDFPFFSLYLWCLYEQKPFYFNVSECVNLFLYAVWFLYLALKNPFITQDQKGIFLYCALSFMVLLMIFIHGVNLASFWFFISGKQPTPNFSGLKHFILLMDFVLGI